MITSEHAALLRHCNIETNYYYEEGTYETQELLLCMAKRLGELEEKSSKESSNTAQWLLLFAGALVFMMQTGFAMLWYDKSRL